MTLRAFQCFAAGTHTDMHGRTLTFSKMQLARIAGSYQPSRGRAPLVLGHPADHPPPTTYGFVEALVAHEESLFCIADITPALQQLVKDGRYKNVSCSFLSPGAPGNQTDGYYIRHVGFLGATPPAVKGMQPLAFGLSLGTPEDALLAAVDSASFAAFRQPEESPRAQLWRVAKDLHRAVPGSDFTTLAISAERALARKGNI